MFKKLRNNLLLINLLITSVIIIASFIGIYLVIVNDTNMQNKEKINRSPFVSFLSKVPKENKIDNEVINDLRDNYHDLDNNFKILLNDKNEIIEIISFLDIEENEYNKLNEILTNSSGKITFNNSIWIYEKRKIPSNINEKISNNEIVYQIDFLNITETEKYLDTILFTLIIIGILVLIVIFFISKFFANKAIKPIENMWLKQKQFVADATHELKTPLTIINANLDVVEMNKKNTVKSQNKWLTSIKNQTISMNKLITDLLNSSNIDEKELNIEKVNIKEVIEEISLSIEALSYEKNIKYKTNLENISINTDKLLLQQSLLILLDNALKYTNESGYIKINLYKQSKHIIIEIINSGIGITSEDLPNIFDRFYKGDKARTNKDNSFGLGLFIAKNIISKLKGDIIVTSKINKETKFIIKI